MKPTTIHLGYAVPAGGPVSIPLRHMAVVGQTQESGKTTTLEALIARSGARAITFVTKRGEGAFTRAFRIDPYFREQADWQFVASILEASRGEKLKFERSWIIRASKGARTLADVQANVRKSLETAKGLSGDVYLTLDAYLDQVVPQIAAVEWATSVKMADAGISVMDLTALNVEMQHLVIKSTLDWVLAKEQDVIVVVPEAWKFIPQGRGTPVKLAAESFIRQAAGLRNYLWLDSQDIAGVEKIILKSVPVWILGVQREFNEVKRTLAQIPAGVKKPRAEAIATLGVGQFFACWGEHVVKTYVQPAWMPTGIAERIARGECPVDDEVVRGLAPRVRADSAVEPTQKPRVGADRKEAMQPATKQLTLDDLATHMASLTKAMDSLAQRVATAPPAIVSPVPVRATTHTVGTRSITNVTPAAGHAAYDAEAFYQHVKRRLVEDAAQDPTILELLTRRPQLVVKVHKHTVTVDGTTVKGRVGKLIAQEFFKDLRSFSAVRGELKRTGPDVNNKTLSNALADYVAMGFLTDEGSGFVEVGDMKSRLVEEEAEAAA